MEKSRLICKTCTEVLLNLFAITQFRSTLAHDLFRKQEITTLISTNVLARGIDVPEVDLVINYEVPYINDFGFKARNNAQGLRVTFKAADFISEAIQLNFTVVSKRWMTKVMRKARNFNNVRVAAKAFAHFARDLGNFKGVC